jgi:DNA excision repair protein ERCC-5
LTSWAGRAFQRAISTLATHEPRPDSSGRTSERESIEVAAIGLATDYGRAFADDVPVDQSATGPSQDESHSSPVANHIVQRTPVFIDTSLQGLTDAHNALLEEEKAMERDMSTITDEMKADILELLQLCGIPWIESPSEAEAQCAALEELGLVDGVVTEDSDIFVFGEDCQQGSLRLLGYMIVLTIFH